MCFHVWPVPMKTEYWVLIGKRMGQPSPYSDLLPAVRYGDRISVGAGARFSEPLQTGPGAQPVSFTMGTRSFLGIKRLGRGVDYPTLASAEVKERVEL